MSACDNKLSWDGVLCNHCRQIFDDHIAKVLYKDSSHSAGLWWHSVASLRKCASCGCKLCETTLSSIREDDIGVLESWSATLRVHVFSYGSGAIRFRVLRPHDDPRPELDIDSATDRLRYRYIVVEVEVLGIEGKISSYTTSEMLKCG